MTHADEGMIVAIRDGELVGGEAAFHVGSCSHCRATLNEARVRSEVVLHALAGLDGPVAAEEAKRSVRARLDRAREADARPTARLRAHLGRAAVVLLLAAGAAYALPGSPVPAWLDSSGEVETGPTALSDDEGAPQAAVEGGIEVGVPEGRIRVVLRGVTPGSAVDVVWTDRATARVVAGAGSSFSFSEGLAEAEVVAGAVRVELPRYAPTVSVEVDGRTFVRRGPHGLEVLGPAVARSADRIRFVAPGR